MTNPLEWIAATSSHHGGSGDPGELTLTTAAAWATVIAAVGAIVALGIASYTIWSSSRALIRERQLTFELGVLAQLAHACAHPFTGGELADHWDEYEHAVSKRLGQAPPEPGTP